MFADSADMNPIVMHTVAVIMGYKTDCAEKSIQQNETTAPVSQSNTIKNDIITRGHAASTTVLELVIMIRNSI